MAKRHLRLQTPVIYECLDVHRLLAREDVFGAAMRALEHRLLRRCKALVVSSPAFVREHFLPRYGGHAHTHLVENRMVDGMHYGERPRRSRISPESEPLRIGWFGILRCSRSLDLLVALADSLGDKVHIDLRGRVSAREIPDFDARVADRSNISFGGAFKAPEDLSSIYGSVDVVWAGDFMEAGYNSVWLLPNRLYEGGYFGVPAIAPEGTETANWIQSHSGGYEVAEPLHSTLEDLIGDLLTQRESIAQKSDALLALPVEVFVEPRGAMNDIIVQSINGSETSQ
ncbi:MAG: hypothetical protein AAFY34_00245 [Pseudomonadota bacterium]